MALNDGILNLVKTPDNLKVYVEQITEYRGGGKYVCPLCGSGNGPKHTPGFNIYGPNKDKWKCFSCQQGGDVLDLIGAVEGIDGYTDRLLRAIELFNIDATEYETEEKSPKKPVEPPKVEAKEKDYSTGQARERAYIEECAARVELASDYLKGRGWTLEEAKECGLGYDPFKKRLILPWPGSDYYHCDRDVTDTQKAKYLFPPSEEDLGRGITQDKCVGPKPIYNPKALDQDAFIVVEGAMDALAIIRCGVGAVVALGGTGYQALLSELKARHYQGCVVLMLDNDEAGIPAQRNLAKELYESGITYRAIKYPEGCTYKDADEYLRTNRESARSFFSSLIGDATEKAENADRNPNMTLHDPAKIAEMIYLNNDADEPIPTGFKELDEYIGGGLMRGLYIEGATSSYGKTTNTLQICDHIAASGHPALFVTIEQSAREITAKSLSRLTHDPHNSIAGGLTSQEITTAISHKSWDAKKWTMLARATDEYVETIAPYLRILEGIRRPSVADIRAAAEKMAADYGEPPTIFIDYLQLLAPKDERDSDKATVDYNVTALRQFARDLKTPIWCVATLNRDSYSGPVDLDSFKESGSIEYGADYAFGLQPRGIAKEVEKAKSAVEKKLRGNAFVAKSKRGPLRQVELTVLKNRQGDTTGTEEGIFLAYYPRTNIFIEG